MAGYSESKSERRRKDEEKPMDRSNDLGANAGYWRGHVGQPVS